MRKFSLLLVLVVVFGAIAGCSGGSVSEAAATDKYSEIENQSKAAGADPQKP